MIVSTAPATERTFDNPDIFHTSRPARQTRPACPGLNNALMVTHVSYIQAEYRTPEECVRGIREHVDQGWRISQIRGAEHGPYVVIFRMDDSW
jgi:hypothetical protein